MAKIILKFEKNELKQLPLTGEVCTIGRLPNNTLQIDNPAVSSKHASIYWESDHFVVEDNHSLNGTYVGGQPVTKYPLRHGDAIQIGKHTVVFQDDGNNPVTDRTVMQRPQKELPKMQETMVLDTKKAREMVAAAMAGTPPPSTTPAARTTGPVQIPAPVKERVALLKVMAGKTDAKEYVLSGKLAVIGKSDMASIKLKGWFAPKVSATITKQQAGYTITPADRSAKLKVNGAPIMSQHELQDGDIIEAGKAKFLFSWQ